MKTDKGKASVFMNGFIKENPILVLILGTCPTLALSTQAINGIGMGLCVTFVLTGSNIMISALKRIIPEKVRIPCYIVIISTFVTITQLLLQAYLPELNKSLGLYIPLIVVNCIILGRAEAFANKSSVFDSMMDGLGMGLSYTVTLTIMASIRELLGAGTVFGYTVTAELITPMSIFILAPGGFFTYGCLIALMNKLTRGKKKIASDKCTECPGAQLCSQAEEGGAE